MKNIIYGKNLNNLILLYLKPLTGIKGRIQSRNIEIDEETKRQVVEVVAEKVTYLSSKKADE